MGLAKAAPQPLDIADDESATAVAWLRLLLVGGLFGLVAAVNGNGLTSTIQDMSITGGGGTDWKVFVAAAGLEPFRATESWHWSPVAAWLFVPLAPMGLVAWQALHVLALGLLPTWRFRIAVLASWPFWWDLSAGNINTFILIAAYWMVRRNPVGIFLTLVIALLVPRPFEIVLVAYVLHREPGWRRRFIAIAVVNAILILGSGQAFAFAAKLMRAGADMTHWGNVAPSLFVAQAWMLVAVPLVVIVYRRGFLGISALLANPYWLPYYLLLPLLDFAGRRPAARPDREVAPTRPAVTGIVGTARDQLQHHWLRWLGLAIGFGIVEGALFGHTSALLFQGWRVLLLVLGGSLVFWALRISSNERRARSIQGGRPAAQARRAPSMVADLIAVSRRLVVATLGRDRGAIPVVVFGVAVSLVGLIFDEARVPAVVWLALTAAVLVPRQIIASALVDNEPAGDARPAC